MYSLPPVAPPPTTLPPGTCLWRTKFVFVFINHCLMSCLYFEYHVMYKSVTYLTYHILRFYINYSVMEAAIKTGNNSEWVAYNKTAMLLTENYIKIGIVDLLERFLLQDTFIYVATIFLCPKTMDADMVFDIGFCVRSLPIVQRKIAQVVALSKTLI